MKDRPVSKKRRTPPWVFGAFVLISLTVLILLQTSNLWKGFSVDTASDTLLLYGLSSLNFIAFVIFGFIFLRSIIKLARERRTLQLGSRIKMRLLLYFVAISILPIVAMAGFSYLFMNRALESWFSEIPKNVVREAREFQLDAAAERSLKLSETAQMIAAVLGEREPQPSELAKVAEAGNLSYIEIVNRDGAVRTAAGHADAEMQGAIDPLRRGVVSAGRAEIPAFDTAAADLPGGRRLIIVPVPRTQGDVDGTVDNALVEFDRLKDRQITVRQIGMLTLGILTFLLIFASTWTAFYIARGLTVPIKALAEGAGKIAQGDLSHRVNTFAEDELALLVSAFNQMSAKLEENSAELSSRKRYIETVLESLPTGVISFDGDNRIGTVNRAATEILKLGSDALIGRTIDQIASGDNLAVLERVIARAKRTGTASEQSVLHFVSKSTGQSESAIPVALTATALPGEAGAVLVVEDLSELIAAQRASAWQEVARRMAHEIKNPLTPIQLSAERIAKRFRDRLLRRSDDAQVVHSPAMGKAISLPQGDPDLQTEKIINDGTATILREVASLKSMVDEFSAFARLPNARPEMCDLNEIIRHVAGLYEDRLSSIEIELKLSPELPQTMLDNEQIKRVFVNLIDNAVEAFEDSPGSKIVISTRNEAARGIVVAEVADNGKGIEPADFQKLFQPYFSTKGRGTGLGLAIVQRIVTEHEGKIKAVKNGSRGAKFIIELPTSA